MKSDGLWLGATIALLGYALFAHLYFGEYLERIALAGFSALDFTYAILFPENFTRDYPGGAWSTGNSLLSWIYPSLYSIGIPVEQTLIAMIALEILILAYGAGHLMTTLYEKIHPVAIGLLVAVFTLSWIRYPNLAIFGTPFFHGQFYGYADGFRLLAISCFFRGHWRSSGLLLAIGFTIHPVKTIFGFLFIIAAQLVRWRELFRSDLLLPYGLFMIFAFFWSVFWLTAGIPDRVISSEDFFRFAPLLNSHWFPQDLGILDVQHHYFATPFLASLLVVLAILLRSDLRLDHKTGLLCGVMAIVLLSSIGVVVGWLELSVSLVKVSLQRSSVLALSLAAVLLVAQTVTDLFRHHWWYAILGASLIAVAFVSKITWPIAIAVIYLVSAYLESRSRDDLGGIRKIALAGGLIGIAYQSVLLVHGYQIEKFWVAQAGILVLLIIGYLAIRFLAPRLGGVLKSKRAGRFEPIVVAVAVVAGVIAWAEDNRRLDADYIARAKSYREVQEWARRHTDSDALFMVDPCHAYGWRDYSMRSSFGSIHEWYKTGWLYTGDAQAFEEGMRRGRLLGIEVERYVPPTARNTPWDNNRLFCERTRETYYGENSDPVARIAASYGIRFVLMEDAQASRYGAIPDWPIAFENEHYKVLIPPGQLNSS